MLSNSSGRSPFPGAIYAFTTNTFTPRDQLLRFDPAQFPNPGFRTHMVTLTSADGGAICSDGTNLWCSPRSAVSSQAQFFILNPNNLTIINQFTTNSTILNDSGLGSWSLDFDGTYIWGARRGFNGNVNGNFINCGLVQINATTFDFQNAANDNVMQLWNGQFLGWVMQARSSSNGALYTWAWPYPDYTGIGYPGPGAPLEIAVDLFSPIDSASTVVMQAVSSTSGALITWTSPTEDFAGTLFPGPGSPLQITVVGRNLVIPTDNISITMQAKDNTTNQISTWSSQPNSPDFTGTSYPGPGSPSDIAVDQTKYNI